MVQRDEILMILATHTEKLDNIENKIDSHYICHEECKKEREENTHFRLHTQRTIKHFAWFVGILATSGLLTLGITKIIEKIL